MDSMKRPVVLITFSGIDGAGKSTQIDLLSANMTAAGARIVRLSFWDNVVVWSSLRERSAHRIFRGEKGAGSPDRPVARRDKNVKSWYLTAIRMLFYLVDAIRLNFVARGRLARGPDAVIFDRYIYDELANLPIDDPWMKRYVRLVLRLTPTPGIACLLDADPIQATQRKPEYPLDFVHANRKAYLALSKLEPAIRVIGPASVPEVQEQILKELMRLRSTKLPCPAFIDLMSASPGMTSGMTSSARPV